MEPERVHAAAPKRNHAAGARLKLGPSSAAGSGVEPDSTRAAFTDTRTLLHALLPQGGPTEVPKPGNRAHNSRFKLVGGVRAGVRECQEHAV